MDVAAISQMIMIDFLSVPFIVSGEDPIMIKELLGEYGKTIKILSKIDTLDGIQNFEAILQQSDGCIIVRNEIKWELASEKLMLAQKWAI